MKNDGNIDIITSVEVILPSGRSCRLPSLPEPRSGHTQSGLTACGGWGGLLVQNTTWHTCVKFAAGVWKRSHTLAKSRWFHIAWQSPAGILLMGGNIESEHQTSELLSSTTSTTSPGFNFAKKTL